MIDPVWLKVLLKAFLLPPTGLLLLSAVGLGLFARFPRFGRALATTGIVVLLVISVPVVADALGDFVDTSPPLDVTQLRDAKAIVILGAGVRRHAGEYGGDTLNALTLERVRYGARVARFTGLPVFVSGGSVLGGEPEANLMRAALKDEFNVPVRWIEARSRTTHENAVLSADMLRKDGIHRVLLVAHGFDMRRAIAEFAAQGIDTVPAPTGKRDDTHYTVLDFLPTMSGLVQSYFAIYEILANLVLALHRGN